MRVINYVCGIVYCSAGLAVPQFHFIAFGNSKLYRLPVTKKTNRHTTGLSIIVAGDRGIRLPSKNNEPYKLQ